MHIDLPEKRYYGIGEVAKAFNVNTSLIRFWEKEFDAVKPKKNAKGNRKFTPEDIKTLEGKPSPDGNGTIQIKKGIEVGHIFKLGEIYADSMKANVLNKEGKASTLFMGCYGIGVSRLVASAIEQNNDDKGIIWPHSIAPYDINIIAIGYDKNQEIATAANDLYGQLKEMGYEVLLDDRKDGYGTKIKDSELIGIPLNIIIGKQFTENKEVELKSRSGESSLNPISDIETILEFFKDK